MADLTDPRVIHLLEISAASTTDCNPEDVETFAAAAPVMLAYHQQLLSLMAAALAETPGSAQQAVYDAQAAKVEEMGRFNASAGISFTSSFIAR